VAFSFEHMDFLTSASAIAKTSRRRPESPILTVGPTSDALAMTSIDLYHETRPALLLPAGLRLGAVELTVRDLGRSVAWYERALGLHVLRHGDAHASLGDSRDTLVVLHEDPLARPAGRGTAGLYHFALLFGTREKLARAGARLAAHSITIEGASDDGFHEPYGARLRRPARAVVYALPAWGISVIRREEKIAISSNQHRARQWRHACSPTPTSGGDLSGAVVPCARNWCARRGRRGQANAADLATPTGGLVLPAWPPAGAVPSRALGTIGHRMSDPGAERARGAVKSPPRGGVIPHGA